MGGSNSSQPSFIEEADLSCSVKFKGGEPSNKEKVEAFFEINPFDKIKDAYKNKAVFQDAFEKADLKFPRDEAEVSSFLFDLTEPQAQTIIAAIAS